MATTRKSARKSSEPTSITTKIRVEVTSDTPTYYSNYIEISHNRHEFAMTVARAPSKVSPTQIAEAKATGEFVLTPEIQILFPPSLISGLIDALIKQREAFDREHGAGK